MAKKPIDANTGAAMRKPSHVHGGEAGAIAGEVAGGVLGSAAGPAGAVAGMVVGAAVGALVGEVLDHEATRAHVHDEELDEDIGVRGGNLGAAPRRKG
jgi:phage tail tape-measure protein